MIVLLVNAYPADREDGDALVNHHAAVALARIVRSRGRQLFVKADRASLQAVITACAEAYSPEARRSLAQQGFPEVGFAEDPSRYGPAGFEDELRDDEHRSSWNVLTELAGAGRIEERAFDGYIMETRRKLVIALGSPDFVASRIEGLRLAHRPDSHLFVEDITRLPPLPIEAWDVRTAFARGPFPEPESPRGEPEEIATIRRAAGREARLRLAMEWAVDQFLGEPY